MKTKKDWENLLVYLKAGRANGELISTCIDIIAYATDREGLEYEEVEECFTEYFLQKASKSINWKVDVCDIVYFIRGAEQHPRYREACDKFGEEMDFVDNLAGAAASLKYPNYEGQWAVIAETWAYDAVMPAGQAYVELCLTEGFNSARSALLDWFKVFIDEKLEVANAK